MKPYKKILIKTLVVGALASVFFVVGSAKASAATYFWVGPLDNTGVTSQKLNWNSVAKACGGTGDAGAAPVSGDIIKFGDPANKCSSGATIDVALSVASITVDSTYVGTITNTAGITVAGSFAINTVGMPMAGAGLTTFNGVSVSSILTCSGIYPGTVVVSKSGTGVEAMTISAGCSITTPASPSWSIGNGGLTNNGTITIPSGIWTTTSGSGAGNNNVIINNGVITHNGNGWDINGQGFINNVGATTTYAGSTMTIENGLIQSGTFDTTGKTIIFDSNLGNASSLTCSGVFPGAVRVSRTKNNPGTFTISNNCSITTEAVATWTVDNGNGALTNNGTITVPAGGTWSISDPGAGGATVVNNGIITHNGTGWTAGSLVSLTNNANATITAPNLTGATSIAGSFTNSGTITWGTTRATLSVTGNITNNVGASFTFGGTSITTSANFTQSGTFSSSGTTIFNGGATASLLTCAGAFSGTVTISKTNANAGTNFTLSSQCSINLGDNPTSAMGNAGIFTNGGTITINSGTWTITGGNGGSPNGGLINNGTINHNGNGWTIVTVNSGVQPLGNALTNNSTGVINYSGTTMSFFGGVTLDPAGTFNTTGKTMTFIGGAYPSALTCTGTLLGTVAISKTLANAGTNFTLSSGCSINLGDSPVSTLGFGTLANNGIITINSGTWTISGGSGGGAFPGFTNNGIVNHNGSGWAISNGGTPAGTILTNSTNGVINYSGTTFAFTNGAFSNSGTFTAPNITGATSLTSSFTNDGTINWGTTGAALTIAGSLTNNANKTFTFGGTSLSVGGSLTINGTLTAANMTALTVNGSLNQSGTFTAPDSLVTTFYNSVNNTSVSGTLTCSGTFPGTIRAQVIQSGNTVFNFTLSSNCTASVNTAASWSISYGSNSGNATFTNNGIMNVASGTWTITTGGFNYTQTFINNGTINHNGSGWVFQGNVFTNAATGVINYLGSSFSVSGSFTQSGTYNFSGITIFTNNPISNNSNSILTCTGTFPGTVRGQSESSAGKALYFTLAAGCTINVDTTASWNISNGSVSGSITNSGTMNVASGTWTINASGGAGYAQTFVNNGTINHSGTGWALNNFTQFTNNAAGAITYTGSSLSLPGSFTNSGTIAALNTLVTFNGSINSTVTLNGPLNAGIQISKANNTYSATLVGSTTINGNLVTSTGASGNFVTPAGTNNLTIGGNVNLGSTGTFSNASTTLVLSGAGKSLTMNGANITGIAGITWGAAGQSFNYVSGTFFTNYSFGSNATYINLNGGTFSTGMTLTGSGQSLYQASTSTLASNINFNGSGITTLNMLGAATAGTTTINQSDGYVALSGAGVFWNLAINAGQTLDSSDGVSSYNTTIFNDILFTGTFLPRSGTVVFNHNGRSKTMALSAYTFYNVTLTSAESAANYTTIFTGGLNLTNSLAITTTGGSGTYSHTWGVGSTTAFAIAGDFTMTASGAVPVFSVATTTIFNMTGDSHTFTVTGGTFGLTTINMSGSGTSRYTKTTATAAGTTVIAQSSGSVSLGGNSNFYNLTISSGNVLDASPDNGANSYNMTIIYNFTNNAGATGFVGRNGTVTFDHSQRNAAITTGGATFNNLTFTANEGDSNNYTTTLNNDFTVAGNLSMSYPSCAVTVRYHTWAPGSPIVITLQGSFSETSSCAAGSRQPVFGDTTTTLNMTGADKSLSNTGYGYFNANLNFNGTGTTTVSKGGSASTAGLTTIAQPSGSVVLGANSNFYNLTISSGNVLDASPDNGANSYNMTIIYNFTNNAGATGFVGRNGTVTFDHSQRNAAITTGGATFNNLTFTANEGDSTSYSTNLSDSFTVAGNLSLTYPGCPVTVRYHTWAPSSAAITVTAQGNFSETSSCALTSRQPIFGNSSTTLNMTGAGKAFTNTGYGYLNAKLNFNGTGTTTVNTSTMSGISTTTIAQSSGSVVLNGASTFYNMIINSGSTLATGASSSYNLTASGYLTNNGTFSGGSATTVTVTGNLLLNSGIFTANSGTLNLGGAVALDVTGGGTFVHNNSLVNLNGTNQRLNGDLTFYKLSKVASGTHTLTFNSGYTYTVVSTTTFTGTGYATKMVLAPSLEGQAWYFDPQGPRSFNYISPWYSNNINGTPISALNSSLTCTDNVAYCDKGFNVNWLFGSGLRAYWVGPEGGNVSNNANWASSSGGAGGSASPSASYMLFFDGGKNTGAIFDSSALASYAGIYISADHSASITQAANRSMALTNNGFVQLGGVFNGSAAGLTTNSFVMGGGTFNAPTTVTDTGAFNISSGTFNAPTTLNVAGSFIDNTTPGGSDISTGMSGYWGLDEASGGTCAGGKDACDSSGNGNHGTWVSSPTPTASVPTAIQSWSTKALTFNGSSQYVTTSYTGNYTSISVSLWLKTTAIVNSGIYSQSNGNTYTKGYTMTLSNSGHDLVLFRNPYNPAPGQVTSSGIVVNDGNWHHVVGTIVNGPGGYEEIFIDGVSRGKFNDNGTYGSTAGINLIVGARQDLMSGTGFLNGSIDDVRIYPRALSAGEVLALAQGNNSGTFSSGAFTPGTGTVNLTGGSQTITSQGTTTFNNLSKTVGSTATFTANKVFNILGSLTLSGASGNYMALRSSSYGTQWKINAAGTRNLNYLDVKDSNNINATAMAAGGTSVDSGNNTGWTFSVPGTTISTSGSQVATTTIPTTTMLGGAFKALGNSPGGYITSIKFTQRGSLSTSNISNVRLFYSNSGSCYPGLVYDGGMTSAGTASVNGNTYTFSMGNQFNAPGIPVDSITPTCFYIQYDTTGTLTTALAGKSVDLAINNPTTDVLMAAGFAVPSSLINISGTTVIDATSLGISSLLSLESSDSSKNPTVFYLLNGTLWLKEGNNAPTRLTPANITVAAPVGSAVFVKTTSPTTNTQVVKISFILNEVDPKNLAAPTYSKTFNMSATVRATGQ